MNMVVKFIKKIKLTPVLFYGILLIVDNLLYLPIWEGAFGYFNQGALGNIMSLIIVVLSIITVSIERFVLAKKRTINKMIIIVELILILLSTSFYWFVFLAPPFPTFRLLMN